MMDSGKRILVLRRRKIILARSASIGLTGTGIPVLQSSFYNFYFSFTLPANHRHWHCPFCYLPNPKTRPPASCLLAKNGNNSGTCPRHLARVRVALMLKGVALP
jgi:hypothetical protein